ncbi:MAG: flagellar biosynthesis protein FliQ [Armatimonadetes bacterium]|nr:flagellar biosynthesis protein FliQ [Armatimonadota bacterium]
MDSAVLHLAQKSISIALILCAPVLIVGLVVGLLVSIFQAATQIQEATISFVPKIIAVVLSGVFFGPWMLKMLVGFSRDLLLSIPQLVR